MNRPASLSNARAQHSLIAERHEVRQHSPLRRIMTLALWVIGLLLLAGAAYIVHNHPSPWPIELSFSRSIQGLPYWPGVTASLDFIGTFNNPTPTGVALGVLIIGMLLMSWYRQALFLALTVGIGNGLDALIGKYVQRPRPSPSLIHVDVLLKYDSFPSGHCCHAMVFYGFLLFLSFTRPVRHWRYRWTLIPLQLFALLNILLIGYSRVYEGEHWLFDVLGGYLSGALWLALFIFLYQWTTRMLEKRRAKKSSQHTTAAQVQTV